MLPPCLLRYHLLRAQEPCILYCNTSKKMTIQMSRKKKDEKGWWCVWSNVGLWRRNTVPIITKNLFRYMHRQTLQAPLLWFMHLLQRYFPPLLLSNLLLSVLPKFSNPAFSKRVGWNHRVIGRNEFIFLRVKEKMMMMMNMNELNEH